MSNPADIFCEKLHIERRSITLPIYNAPEGSKPATHLCYFPKIDQVQELLASIIYYSSPNAEILDKIKDILKVGETVEMSSLVDCFQLLAANLGFCWHEVNIKELEYVLVQVGNDQSKVIHSLKRGILSPNRDIVNVVAYAARKNNHAM